MHTENGSGVLLCALVHELTSTLSPGPEACEIGRACYLRGPGKPSQGANAALRGEA
jgi:hypothetical protein